MASKLRNLRRPDDHLYRRSPSRPPAATRSHLPMPQRSGYTTDEVDSAEVVPEAARSSEHIWWSTRNRRTARGATPGEPSPDARGGSRRRRSCWSRPRRPASARGGEPDATCAALLNPRAPGEVAPAKWSSTAPTTTAAAKPDPAMRALRSSTPPVDVTFRQVAAESPDCPFPGRDDDGSLPNLDRLSPQAFSQASRHRERDTPRRNT